MQPYIPAHHPLLSSTSILNLVPLLQPAPRIHSIHHMLFVPNVYLSSSPASFQIEAPDLDRTTLSAETDKDEHKLMSGSFIPPFSEFSGEPKSSPTRGHTALHSVSLDKINQVAGLAHSFDDYQLQFDQQAVDYLRSQYSADKAGTSILPPGSVARPDFALGAAQQGLWDRTATYFAPGRTQAEESSTGGLLWPEFPAFDAFPPAHESDLSSFSNTPLRTSTPETPFPEAECRPLTTSVPLAFTRTQQLFAQKMAAEEAHAAQQHLSTATTIVAAALSTVKAETGPNVAGSSSGPPHSISPDSNKPHLSAASADLTWAQSMPPETIKSFEQLGSLSTVLNRNFVGDSYGGNVYSGPNQTVNQKGGLNMADKHSLKSADTGSGATIAQNQGYSSSEAGRAPTMSPAMYRSSNGDQATVFASPSPSMSVTSQLPHQPPQHTAHTAGRQVGANHHTYHIPGQPPNRKPTQQSLYFQQLIAAKLGQLNASGYPTNEPVSGTQSEFSIDTWTPDERQMDLLPSSRSPLYAISGGMEPSSASPSGPSPYGRNIEPPPGLASSAAERSRQYPPYPLPQNSSPKQNQQSSHGQFPSYPSAPGPFPGFPGWPPNFPGQYSNSAMPAQSSFRGPSATETVTDFWGRTVTRPAQPQSERGGGQDWDSSWSAHHQYQQPGRPASSRDSGSVPPGTPSVGQQGFYDHNADRKPPNVSMGPDAASRVPAGFSSGNGGETIVVPDLTDVGMNSTPWSGSVPVMYGQSDSSTGDRQGDQPKKATLACHFCRGRKLRCDGATPTCAHCVKRGLSCSYDTVIRRRGPGRHKKADKVAAALAATEANGGIVPPEYEAILNPKTKPSKANRPGGPGAKRGRRSKAEKEAALAGLGISGSGMRDDGSGSDAEGDEASGDETGGHYPGSTSEGAGHGNGNYSARSYGSGSGMGYAPVGPPSAGSLRSNYPYASPYHGQQHQSQAYQQPSWVSPNMNVGHAGHFDDRKRLDGQESQSLPTLTPGSYQQNLPAPSSSPSLQNHNTHLHPLQQHSGYYSSQMPRFAPMASAVSNESMGRARSPLDREPIEDQRESKRARV